MSPFRRPRTISTAALAAFILLVPFEEAEAWLREALLLIALIAFVVERRGDFRSAPSRRRGWVVPLAWSLGGFAATGLAAATAAAIRRLELAPLEIGVEALRRSLTFWLGFPWLFRLAVLRRRRLRDAHPDDPALAGARRLDAGLWGLVAAWAGWLIVASVIGRDPELSFEHFQHESGAYLLAFGLFNLKLQLAGARRGEANGVETSPPLAAAVDWTRWTLLVAGLISLAAVAFAAIGYAGPEKWVSVIEDREFIRIDQDKELRDVIRVQFPFGSHNRLGSYLLAVMMLIAPVYALTRRRRVLLEMLAVGAAAFFAVLVTGTRGAVIAGGVGLAVLIAGRPRLLALFAPLLLVLVMMLPATMRGHLTSILRPSTYLRSNPDLNVRYRYQEWDVAWGLIRERPILGHGYGWSNYEEKVGRPHAHENFLQIWFETGGVGLALFLAFQGLIAVSALRLALRAPRGSPLRAVGWGVIALLAAIHFFGLTNFSLRRTVGYQLWLNFAMVHALVVCGLARVGKSETPTPHPPETA